MIYGYCRISTAKQNIERQERNIHEAYPDAVIVKEAFTGTKMHRPQWDKLYSRVAEGDTIVFDSVSRMSRNAEEGIITYFELYQRGINLVFLKEHYIDTATYNSAKENAVPMTNTAVDCILQGVNEYLTILAKEQIKIAFEQAEKEVMDLRKRTSEGIQTAKLNGRQVGAVEGKKLTTKKSVLAKEVIKKHSKDFSGTLTDIELMQLTGLARNTYYKYKRELKEGE